MISNIIFIRKYSPSIPVVVLFLLPAACNFLTPQVTPPDLPADGWVRDNTPILTAGTIGADGWLDISIADPDALYDPVEDVWHVWYQAGRAKAYTSTENRMVIRHARSDDGGASWTVDPQPAFELPGDPSAWDATHSETPRVDDGPWTMDRRPAPFHAWKKNRTTGSEPMEENGVYSFVTRRK